MKTVKCPKCQAEQTIYNRQGNTMNCVFCGAEIELPEFEDGESDFRKKEEPEAVKKTPEGEKITCEYILNSQEVEKALFMSGKLKKRGVIVWIETAVFAFLALSMVFAAVAGYNGWFSMSPPDGSVWFILVVALLFIPIVWIMPLRNKKRMIDSATTGNKIAIDIYDNVMEIAAEGAEPWQLDFEEPYHCEIQDGIILVTLSNRQILPIPERAFKESELEKAKNIILSNSADNKAN